MVRAMHQVTVSPKFQVVIPEAVREIGEMREFLAVMDSGFNREQDRGL